MSSIIIFQGAQMYGGSNPSNPSNGLKSSDGFFLKSSDSLDLVGA